MSTTGETPYIICVDDEEDLREPTTAYLRDQGLDVGEAENGAALDVLLTKRIPSLVVLDVTMPVEDGFSVARRLRAAHGNIGIIMLTARRDVIDRVVGLELGADDYIMKPFDPRELLARIRSVLRRLATQSTSVPPSEEGHAPAPEVLGADGGYHREFWVPTASGQIRVPVDSVDWIEAAKDYALLHTPERSHMIRVTMSALEVGLDPAQMMRVHRSAFVRPDAVQKVSVIGRHMSLVLHSGATVRVGPRHWESVREQLRS